MRFALIALAACVVSPAHAGLVNLSTSDNEFDAGTPNQGWWSENQAGGNNNTNSSIHTGDLAGVTLRSFFTFDLTAIDSSQTIQSATLTLPKGGTSTNFSGTLLLFDVSTAADVLNDNDDDLTLGPSIYADLGSGTSYGSLFIDTSTSDPFAFDLNAAGIAAIQTAVSGGGGFFSIGGRLQDE
ncbi:MAG TPA: hypothetical protein DDW52_09235, partial [Planctomycetaceae bacterium]|nr:hypothetical protein [Planctomycetaceae bacterium]